MRTRTRQLCSHAQFTNKEVLGVAVRLVTAQREGHVAVHFVANMEVVAAQQEGHVAVRLVDLPYHERTEQPR